MPVHQKYKFVELDHSNSEKVLRDISSPIFLGLEDNKIIHTWKILEKILN